MDVYGVSNLMITDLTRTSDTRRKEPFSHRVHCTTFLEQMYFCKTYFSLKLNLSQNLLNYTHTLKKSFLRATQMCLQIHCHFFMYVFNPNCIFVDLNSTFERFDTETVFLYVLTLAISASSFSNSIDPAISCVLSCWALEYQSQVLLLLKTKKLLKILFLSLLIHGKIVNSFIFTAHP